MVSTLFTKFNKIIMLDMTKELKGNVDNLA